MYRPVTLVVPCAALIPKPLSFSVNQNEVEENITHLMTLARIALEKGDVEKAEAILEMGIKISAEYQSYLAMPYMYDILASVAFAKGNLKKAELLLVRVIEELIQLGAEENDSQIIDFKLRLARIYSSYEEKELAEIGFKTCLADQEAKIIKGDITTKTGLLYVNILFWYGMHQLQNANYKKAKQLIDLAYNHSLNIKGLTPYQEMIILYTMADLNIKLQSYDVAFQNIQSAIFLGKGIGSVDLPKFYLKLAAIYMKIGAKR
ncbi:hypothetical protein NQ317_003146 [Molorchus minor]|uniref:MalT-like TPR region domain-containing protein n=1 Tax=Molorchus minor TaxID=1323400 RepID=A0ABQ9JY98_9CUCU|nr:hypothetical protein NQ317_003146 [Molorchus minor]